MAVTIDHRGPMPLYQQLAAILREQIRSGELQPDRPIPSEPRLQQMYEVGRDTARSAVKLLREEGWVVTVHPRGTFVVPRDQWPADDE
jgi:DNA-binding GntR family transcriptional regulator